MKKNRDATATCNRLGGRRQCLLAGLDKDRSIESMEVCGQIAVFGGPSSERFFKKFHSSRGRQRETGQMKQQESCLHRCRQRQVEGAQLVEWVASGLAMTVPAKIFVSGEYVLLENIFYGVNYALVSAFLR